MSRTPRSVARRVAAVAVAAVAGAVGLAGAIGVAGAAEARGGGAVAAGPPAAGVETRSATPTRPAPSAGRDHLVGVGPPLVVWTREGGVRAPHPADPAAVAELLLARAGLTLRVVGLLDAVAPFPWRAAVGTLAVGCRPVADLDCPGGVVDRGDRLTVSPAAGRWSDATLAYVLRHELAHVWQHATGELAARRRDLDGVALPGDVDRLEAAADCLAAAWGSPARGNGYLACPPDGVARMAAVFAATPAGTATGTATAAPSGVAAPQATAASRPGRAAGTMPSSSARTAASVRPSTPSFR